MFVSRIICSAAALFAPLAVSIAVSGCASGDAATAPELHAPTAAPGTPPASSPGLVTTAPPPRAALAGDKSGVTTVAALRPRQAAGAPAMSTAVASAATPSPVPPPPTPAVASTETPAPTRAAAEPPRAPAQAPRPQAPPAGWLTDYVTTSISIFNKDHRLARTVPRDQVPLPPGGLPFHKADGGLAVVEVRGEQLLVDTSQFEVKPAEALVKSKCIDAPVPGRPSGANASIVMGHGKCPGR